MDALSLIKEIRRDERLHFHIVAWALWDAFDSLATEKQETRFDWEDPERS